jgi:hypothetical protein
VEIAAASTAVSTTLRRELVVDAKKQGEELRVLQQGMAHWDWSLLVVARDSSKQAVYARSLAHAGVPDAAAHAIAMRDLLDRG